MFKDRIKLLRSGANLTQQVLADKLNLTRSALSLYELGKREPDTETISLFADYFDVSVDYLLGRTDIPNYKDYVFNSDINLLIKHYELSPENLRGILTQIMINFTNLTLRGIQQQDEELLSIYRDVLATLQDFKLAIKNFQFRNRVQNVPDSLVGLMEIQAKYKGDISLLIDKLLQAHLEIGGQNKKARDEMSSASEKHA